MSELIEAERKRVIALAHENHEFCRIDSGFWYYWRQPGKAPQSAVEMRWIADELDRLNAIRLQSGQSSQAQ